MIVWHTGEGMPLLLCNNLFEKSIKDLPEPGQAASQQSSDEG